MTSLALTRAVAKPLRETEILFQAIANGRLNNPVVASGFKEINRFQLGLGVMIEGSVTQTRGGVSLVERAGLAIGTVSPSISRVSSMIGEISGASVEQSTGIAQVNRAVTEMDHMTQKNAALVEQAAAAAQELREQTHHLASAVATFELSE